MARSERTRIMTDNTFTAYEVIAIARYLGIAPKKVEAVGWFAATKNKSAK